MKVVEELKAWNLIRSLRKEQSFGFVPTLPNDCHSCGNCGLIGLTFPLENS